MSEKGLEQCDNCDYFVSVEEAYKQGREDTIKKIIEYAFILIGAAGAIYLMHMFISMMF